MLAAGRLRERLTIERLQLEPDGTGGNREIWQPVSIVWGAVTPIRGDEQIEGGALQSVQGVKMTIRFREDLRGAILNHRVLWRGRRFNIRSAEDPDGRRASLVLMCDSGVAT